jgi:Uma2 family endonuclease
MAEALTMPRLITADEVATWPEEKRRGELLKGVWVPMTMAGWRHGEIVARIVHELFKYLDENPCGKVACNDPGTKLESDPDLLRAPDIGFIAAEHISPEGLPDQWWQGGPDLTVDVVSPSQGVSELIDKAQEFLRAGTRVAWVVDPSRRCILVCTLPDHVTVLHEADILDGGDVLPGFTVPVAQVFA